MESKEDLDFIEFFLLQELFQGGFIVWISWNQLLDFSVIIFYLLVPSSFKRILRWLLKYI